MMPPSKKSAANLSLLGGRACLDFANTLDWRGTDSPVEYLLTCQDLIAWSRHAGILSDQEAPLLSQAAEDPQADSAAQLSDAIRLRETIYRIFAAIAAGDPAPAKDLAAFNQFLAASRPFERLVQQDAGYVWDRAVDPQRLDSVLVFLIRSAVELLVSPEVRRVKRCGDPACGWLFLDTSRNGSRRWCDMRDCGNRAKASRFYRKKKGLK
jgi:predicted RNA-binding Zn ribbon-like protein